MKRFLAPLLPFAGAVGFLALSEASLSRSAEFLLWSVASMVWTVAVFFAVAGGKLQGRLFWTAVPGILMISVSTVAALLFLNVVSSRHGVIAFFAAVLYLFYEHVRRAAGPDEAEERLSISEYARMVNIGSLFLLATAGIGVSVFLSVPSWIVGLAFLGVALLWSWHLFLACTDACGRPLERVVLTALVAMEAYLVALRMPTSMFVGGALVGLTYYLASNLLHIGATDRVSPSLVRKYVAFGGGLLALLLLTARWV